MKYLLKRFALTVSSDTLSPFISKVLCFFLFIITQRVFQVVAKSDLLYSNCIL